jgi:small subunit ribosomal protein S15
MSIDKSSIITQFQINKKDTGSAEVQIALLSSRIALLTGHLRTHNKDVHSRRGLIQMTNRRRKLLTYLKNSDLPKYNDIIVKLGLRK